jgi:hypothetical protein
VKEMYRKHCVISESWEGAVRLPKEGADRWIVAAVPSLSTVRMDLVVAVRD